MLDVNTDLINRAQQGDAEVISALYERYHLSLYRYLYYRVGDQQTAEDLTSEVFVRMLRFLGGFRPPSSSFRAWLFQIARNLANDHFRNTNGRYQVQMEAYMTVAAEDLEATIERNMTSAELCRALNRLSEEHRDVIVLRFVSGLPIAEVAQAFGRSENAIKGLQRRALATLREILADREIHYA